MTVKTDYNVRELLNPGAKPSFFTKNKDFMANNYRERFLKPDTLLMKHQVTIYNDTVATYCWRDDQKVGIEIVNKANAQMMRQVFENYWAMGADKQAYNSYQNGCMYDGLPA